MKHDFPLAWQAPPSPPPGTFLFDIQRARRAIDFFELVLVHTKGRYAGTPFILEPWQKEIIARIFGTVCWDEQYSEYARQYRLAWIELARKNGKSELLSGFALYGLCADQEESAEVYSVAVDRDQAGMVYATAKRMVELSPHLSKMLVVVDSRKRIVHPKSNSFYQVLPGDAGGALGTNPSMVLFDEVLTQRDRHLWDAMRQGFGTRKQPIMIAATTAAYTTAAFALEEHEYGERVLADPTIDPHRYVFMRNVAKDWDWEDEGKPAVYDGGTLIEEATGWYWANPALGTFLSIGTMRAEYAEAKEKPTAQNAFRVFRLNQWVSQANRWLDMGVYDSNGGHRFAREQLAGRGCIGGLDLASTGDFTAWVLLFPGSPTDETADGFTVLPHFFVPRPALEKRAPMRTHLEVWEREGFITVHEGQTTNYDDIETHIAKDAELFHINGFGYDQWNATQVVGHLEDSGLTAVKVPQSPARLNDPCKWLETLIANRTFYHGANPVLRWMVDNVELEVTGDGLVKPSKSKSGEKIDGVAASLNALFVARLGIDEAAPVTFIAFDDPEDTANDGRPKDEIDDLLAILSGGDRRRNYFDDDYDDD